MERKDLETAASLAVNLRGLLAVPMGLLFIATGLGNLGWGPYAEDWVYVATVAVLGAAWFAINRVYLDRYGRVTPTIGRRTRDTALSAVLFGGSMVGGTLLDFTFELPVSLFAIGFALAMLAWFGISVGLRAYHLVVWGGLLVVGLLPVWGGLDDRISVAWLPIGVATIAAGIGDHLRLVRTFGAAGDIHVPA
jgi:hypothetical protein